MVTDRMPPRSYPKRGGISLCHGRNQYIVGQPQSLFQFVALCFVVLDGLAIFGGLGSRLKFVHKCLIGFVLLRARHLILHVLLLMISRYFIVNMN